MLNALVAEQAEKQARLKLLQVEKSMVQTRKVAVQSETHKTAGAAVQTDFPDIMEDLKKTSGKTDQHRGRIDGV